MCRIGAANARCKFDLFAIEASRPNSATAVMRRRPRNRASAFLAFRLARGGIKVLGLHRDRLI
jgi:hypothetical protein